MSSKKPAKRRRAAFSGLTRLRAKRARISKSTRFQILAKTGGACYLCGRIYTDNKILAKSVPSIYFSDLEIDHIVARSVGGPDHFANYLPACKRCNRAKGAKSLHSYIQEQWNKK